MKLDLLTLILWFNHILRGLISSGHSAKDKTGPWYKTKQKKLIVDIEWQLPDMFTTYSVWCKNIPQMFPAWFLKRTLSSLPYVVISVIEQPRCTDVGNKYP